MLHRLAYRARQFWNALPFSQRRVEMRAVLPPLTSAQFTLFQRMQPSEQVHAYRMFRRLQAEGHTEADLLVAALLHDVGKCLYPLSVLDRVAVVLGKRLFPRLARRWGEGAPEGLRRPFVVAAQHPDWGADLAAQAGASSCAVELIRRHQDPLAVEKDAPVERLLAALQAVDDES
jgi:hypothetical protein